MMTSLLPSDRLRRLLLLVAFAAPLALAALGWRAAPPMVNPDSAMGFLTWESHRAGAAWNHLRSPAPGDIGRDREEFLAWWSPAQYEVPGLWRSLGVNWGRAIGLTCLLAGWLQLGGCWLLGRSVGLPPHAAAWFTAVAGLQWHTLYGFGHFRGGDVLLLGVAPWVLLWAWEVRRRPGWFLLSAPVVILAGQYLKLSAVLFTLPVIAVAACANAWALRHRRAVAAAWSGAAIAVVAAAWLGFSLWYLRHGRSPGEAGAFSGSLLSVLGFAFAAPWLAATGAGSFIGRLTWLAGVEAETFWRTAGWLVAPLALLLWAIAARYLLRPLPAELRRGIALIAGGGIALFAFVLLRGAAVALDDRFLRPTALVLLLAFAFFLPEAATSPARLAAPALLAIALFGVLASAQRTLGLLRSAPPGVSGLAQPDIDPAARREFARLDGAPPSSSRLIYVPFPGAALELPRQRVLATDDFMFERGHDWRGRVSELVAALPAAMERDGRGARIRARFRDYAPGEWRAERAGDWYFWTARSPAP